MMMLLLMEEEILQIYFLSATKANISFSINFFISLHDDDARERE